MNGKDYTQIGQRWKMDWEECGNLCCLSQLEKKLSVSCVTYLTLTIKKDKFTGQWTLGVQLPPGDQLDEVLC